jgi:phage-related protein
VEKFINSLDSASLAKVLRTIDLLEKFGSDLSMPHSKKINKDIFELRIHGSQGVRLFYVFRQDGAVIFYAFIKKSNRIPKKELDKIIKKFKSLF